MREPRAEGKSAAGRYAPPGGRFRGDRSVPHTPPWNQARVLITGGHGFLGSAVCRALAARGVDHARVFAPRSTEFDLTQQSEAIRMFESARDRFRSEPDVVVHAAGYVGGIAANIAEPGRFFHDNMAMGLHTIEAWRRLAPGARFVLIGTASAYPADAPVPFREADLWKGLPHPSGAPYGLAKRAAGAMLEMYRAQHGLRGAHLVPINMYGPGDHFGSNRAHVIAALVARFVDAADRADPEVVCWGSGRATRDFLYVDDCAEAVLLAAEKIDEPSPINIGTGRETTIREAAETIAKAADFRGEIRWDQSKPDGQMRRCMDVSRAEAMLGWRAEATLERGIDATVRAYRESRPDR